MDNNRMGLPMKLLVSILFLYLLTPVILVFPLSFSDDQTLAFPPSSWSLRWYRAIFGDGRMMDAFITSLGLATVVTLLSIVVALPLDSSRETIRRDLVALDRDGLLRRYHGGARSLTDAANFQVAEESFSVRLTRHGEAKKKLARLAATLFEPGSSLFVDTGTTTLAFAQELAPLRQCTVITNSLGIASIFGAVRDFRHKIHVLGGEFVPDAQEMLGRTTLRQIADFRAEHVVLTVGSLQVGGILDFDEREAEVAQAMIEHAQKVTVLGKRRLDHTFQPLS